LRVLFLKYIIDTIIGDKKTKKTIG